jgi:DNA invertase Pin-like site-specific DNA recombinase
MNAIIYARISERRMIRDDQGQLVPESDSIEAQLDACRRLATLRGAAVVAEYVDRLKSGLKRRKNFDDALKHARDCKGVLIVRDLLRATRSPGHMADVVEFCVKHRVSILTADGLTLDFTSPHSTPVAEMLGGMLAVVGRFYCRAQASAISISRQKKKHACDYQGGPAPFGLRVRKGKLVPCAPEMETLHMMMAWRERGTSYELIAHRLNHAKCYRRSGKPWAWQQVQRTTRHWREALRSEGPYGDMARKHVGPAVGIRGSAV